MCSTPSRPFLCHVIILSNVLSLLCISCYPVKNLHFGMNRSSDVLCLSLSVGILW